MPGINNNSDNNCGSDIDTCKSKLLDLNQAVIDKEDHLIIYKIVLGIVLLILAFILFFGFLALFK